MGRQSRLLKAIKEPLWSAAPRVGLVQVIPAPELTEQENDQSNEDLLCLFKLSKPKSASETS